MKRHRRTPEQIVRTLSEVDPRLNEGKDLTEVLRHLEVSMELTRFGGRGVSGDHATRLAA